VLDGGLIGRPVAWDTATSITGGEVSDDLIRGNPLIGVERTLDVASAAGIMLRENIGALGIYDGDDLLGILTDRDLTRVVAEYRDPATTAVADAMTIEPMSAKGPITREEAADLMHRGHVRHLILKEDESDRIVSIRDL
jgi:CBS domain-containing protein